MENIIISDKAMEYGRFQSEYFSRENKDVTLSVSACIAGEKTVRSLIHNLENLLAFVYLLQKEGYEMQGVASAGIFTLVKKQSEKENNV